MTQQMILTDTQALARNRAKARQDALFLHSAAADEIKDRLSSVKKSFNTVALVTGFPDFWRSELPGYEVVADHETLDLAPGAYDAVLHVMSLHWANDPVGQLIQCRRALKPDGLLLTVSFGGQTLHELRASLAQAEVSVSGGLSPRVAPMAELRDMGGLLQRAGFALPVADAVPISVEYADIWTLMRDLRAMGEANALAQRLRHPTRRDVFENAAEIYHSSFAGAENRISATFELIFLTGWAPDDSQPKPLRPGSAQQRLADALGTKETKLPN